MRTPETGLWYIIGELDICYLTEWPIGVGTWRIYIDCTLVLSDEDDTKTVKYLFSGRCSCPRMMKWGHTGAQYFALAAEAILIWGFVITTHHVEATCIPSTGCEHALAYYQVQSTDTVDSLNLHFQTTLSTLQSYNKNLSTNITAGQKLLVPFQCMYCSNGQLQHLFQYSVSVGELSILHFYPNYQCMNGIFMSVSSASSFSFSALIPSVNQFELIILNARARRLRAQRKEPSHQQGSYLFI